MVGTITDWQMAGVALKVELATDGNLVVDPLLTPWPLNPGGPNGAPLGWTTEVLNDAQTPQAFNWTTSAGVFSVSNKLGAYANFSPFGCSPAFIVKPGVIYELQVQSRAMAGLDISGARRSPTLQTWTGSAWTHYAGTRDIDRKSVV